MEVKTFAATLGVGMAAGAMVAMMIPKRSAVYHAANDAAKSIKHSVNHAVHSMK